MTTTVTRQIVHIDENLCDGCGICVSPCAEGAIAIIDGKAKVLREELCDGAGNCLGVCPTGALGIETRETVAFDKAAAAERDVVQPDSGALETCYLCGASEDTAPLLAVRMGGQANWCCTRCLPRLIHGG
jgi:NAD-dependent dihydropyrimidine dehydrogenase PreA subunit